MSLVTLIQKLLRINTQDLTVSSKYCRVFQGKNCSVAKWVEEIYPPLLFYRNKTIFYLPVSKLVDDESSSTFIVTSCTSSFKNRPSSGDNLDKSASVEKIEDIPL